jgi:hypothetical protein
MRTADEIAARDAQCAAAATCASGLTGAQRRHAVAWMRASEPGVAPSKRSTSTGVVFEARIRPKPSLYSTRTPSIVTISLAPGNFASARSRSTTRAGSPSTQATFSSGVLKPSGSALRIALGSRARLRISSRPRRGVGGVVEAVPALAEEDVAAHLAGERRVELLHPRLHERMAGLPHHRLAARGADQRPEMLRALDVEEDRRARVAQQHVAREQHQLAIGEDDLAVLR